MVKRLLGMLEFLGQSLKVRSDLDEEPEGTAHTPIVLRPSGHDPVMPGADNGSDLAIDLNEEDEDETGNR